MSHSTDHGSAPQTLEVQSHASGRRRSLAYLATAWLLLPAALVSAQSLDAAALALKHRLGIVESVDYSIPAAVIEGLRYGFEPEARVELGGTYGAPTMITPGMRVDFYFVEDGRQTGSRRIRYLFEIDADAVPIQGH